MGLVDLFSKSIIDKAEGIENRVNDIYEKVNKIVPIEDVPEKGLSIYHLYPYLFEESFKNVDETTFQDIALAGALYSDMILFFDKWHDTKMKFNIHNVIAKNILLQESMKILCKYFEQDNLFWDYMDKYTREYLEALSLEDKNHKGRINQYTEEEYDVIMHGKSAIAKLTVVALSILNHDEKKIAELENTQKYYAEAFQLFDDLRDWQRDLVDKQYTWFVTEFLLNYYGEKEIEIEEAKSILYKSDLCDKTLKKIIHLCDLALLYSIDAMPWIKQIKLLQMRAIRLRHDMENIKGTKSANSVENSKSDNYFEKVKVENMLFRQQINNYPEMVHILKFKHSDGFTCEEETQCGLLFQRLFIFNLIKENLFFQDMQRYNQLINDEWKRLLLYEQEYLPRGYKYFDDLPELAPDLDTLAEAIKAHVNMQEYSEKLDDFINYAIECTWQKEGYFNTWIINNDITSEMERKRKDTAELKWGNDYDIEVNINFIYALARYNYEKYEFYIKECIVWLRKKLSKDGDWDCTWYAMNTYLCYIFSKLVNYLLLDCEIASDIIKNLESMGNENGFWGKTNSSMETAFAILTYEQLKNFIDLEDKKYLIQKGKSFLKARCMNEGYWEAEDFIKMNFKRVEGGEEYVYYQSSTLATVVCLCAVDKAVS